MRLDHLRGSPSARGQGIREQVLAQQHLPNPLTINLPDGTTTRVWLATGKDGKKIVGDALWWGVNCAGKAETPIEVVKSPETAAVDMAREKLSLRSDSPEIVLNEPDAEAA